MTEAAGMVAIAAPAGAASAGVLERRLAAEGLAACACPLAADDAPDLAAAPGPGPVAALVAAADPAPAAGFDATTPTAFRALWEAEVERLVRAARAALRHFGAQGAGGSLVLVMGADGPGPAFAAAAGALAHFCRIAAVEAGELSPPVRVNLVRPAGTGRATPEALAAAAAFLAGPRSRMVTGTTLVVDGDRR
ncbi:MAG: hypothetical protein ACK4MT_09985 [Thermaurantiacus tibetensis]|uniref:hypothetical protein n=1 Tax=Thermaurantiacus tibetensis TaxID=2759035 RepID=UPI00188F1801|nr:hypothetical protein [Thermaurantiacus tibetensis]